MTHRSERGQATILVLGMTMVVFGVVGLAVDGTKAFIFRRTLQSAADAAALAGGGELDTTRYYSTRGRTVRLDPRAADAAARRWLALRGLEAGTAVQASEERVTVTLRGQVETSFLRIIGLSRIPVAVEAASSPAVPP
jgi:uncharacterized membrane protein